MGGYRDPEDQDSALDFEERQGVLNVLLAPIVIGGGLVVYGVSNSSYLLAGIGALILVAVPVMVYLAQRRGY